MIASTQYPVIRKSVPTFYFIGVTTKQSSINQVFPHWTRAMGRPEVVIDGLDYRLNDDPERYRQAVAQIKHDPLSLGALVTTHKLSILNAARDMFDYLDPYAVITGEISCISKRDGRLEGYAKDPITSGLSLKAFLEPGYFGRSGGQILCLGAGGAAVAISLYLIDRPEQADRPNRFVVVDINQQRLDHLREMHQRLDTKNIVFEYICNDAPENNDAILHSLTTGSVVINATGMGKDTPGSPITNAAVFPQDGIAWELNYRGERDFMQQALRQVDARNLRIEDGWVYFIHGWTQVMAQVYGIEIDAALFAELSAIAESVHG